MILEKIWKFLWKDDSIWSWIVSIILAFLIVKFVIYPLLGLILGTDFPVVAVVSSSMEHRPVCPNSDSSCTVFSMCGQKFEENSFYHVKQYWEICGEWYENAEISLKEFSDFPFKDGFNKGDVMILIGKKAKDIKVGDIVVFKSDLEYPIIHRAVSVWEKDGKFYVKTKGDNNEGSSNSEQEIGDSKLIGKAVIRLPLLGWIKIKFSEIIGSLIGR